MAQKPGTEMESLSVLRSKLVSQKLVRERKEVWENIFSSILNQPESDDPGYSADEITAWNPALANNVKHVDKDRDIESIDSEGNLQLNIEDELQIDILEHNSFITAIRWYLRNNMDDYIVVNLLRKHIPDVFDLMMVMKFMQHFKKPSSKPLVENVTSLIKAGDLKPNVAIATNKFAKFFWTVYEIIETNGVE